MTENETKSWAALEAMSEQCVQISERIWTKRLMDASAEQQALAETMRDRDWMLSLDDHNIAHEVGKAIPVPLFTPRDRVQLIKEYAVHLGITAAQRGLSVTEPEDVGPPVKPFGTDKGTPLTAMSGIDLESAMRWAEERPDRSAKFADFLAAAENELQQRAAKTEAIQTQPLTEPPIALATEERP